jgi:hypothetical protein
MDLAQALVLESGKELLQVRAQDISVIFYRENASNLRAAIDCEVPTKTGRNIRLGFVVAGNEPNNFLLWKTFAPRRRPISQTGLLSGERAQMRR